MVEVLRVHAKPGVLATDHRALPARRFIGRDHKPIVGGEGTQFGALPGGLYDPSKLHLGEPVDIEAVFPIREVEGGHELKFDVNHKHPHVAHKEREWHRHVMRQLAEGTLLPADEETAKKCGVKLPEKPAAQAEVHEHPGTGEAHTEVPLTVDEHGVAHGEIHEEHAK